MKAIIVNKGMIKFSDDLENLKKMGFSESSIHKKYPISKNQKIFHDKIGLEVNVTIIIETPDSCEHTDTDKILPGVFCYDDETCIICNIITASITDNESILREYKINKINDVC